jgi:hypothetical protein
MELNIKMLKLIIIQNAKSVSSYDKNPTQSLYKPCLLLFLLYQCIVRPFAEPTSKQDTYVKSFPYHNDAYFF